MSLIDSIKKSLGFSVNEEKPVIRDYIEEEDVEDEGYIVPVQYEIVLIKPRTSDDMDYVFDQVVEERNPVIIDLRYLEEQGLDSFQMAGEKIKILRENYGAKSILLSKTSNNSIILISPSRIEIKEV